MFVDELGHDGDGDSPRALVKELGDLLVLDTNHILSVDLAEVVVYQETVSREMAGEQYVQVNTWELHRPQNI